MRSNAACPDLDRYQQLAAGRLAEADEQSLLAHLEHCEQCAQLLQARGELNGLESVLRQDHARARQAADEPVAGLIERLSKLRPGESPLIHVLRLSRGDGAEQ
jgi:hypothetical protein